MGLLTRRYCLEGVNVALRFYGGRSGIPNQARLFGGGEIPHTRSVTDKGIYYLYRRQPSQSNAHQRSEKLQAEKDAMRAETERRFQVSTEPARFEARPCVESPLMFPILLTALYWVGVSIAQINVSPNISVTFPYLVFLREIFV